MKNLKKIYFIIFCLSLLTIWGCSDDDNNIKVHLETYNSGSNKTITKKIQSLETTIHGPSSLRISGGSGNYTAKSSDESVATVSINENYLHINILKMGSLQITITDSDLTSIVLPVTITEGNWVWTIQNVGVHIRTEDGTEADETILQSIANEIKANTPPAQTAYNFLYESSYAGRLEITIPGKSGVTSGTFSIEHKYEGENYRLVHKLYYDGVEHVYMKENFTGDGNILRTSIAQLMLVANHTEEYKSKYPDLNLTEVFSIQICY